MKDQNNSQNRNFDIASFKRATEGMISKNDESYGDYDYLSYRRTARTTLKDYKPEEIEQIINSGSLQEQRALSKNYFLKDGIYRAIILYYANLLKCAGLLIPRVAAGKKMTSKNLQNRYYKALDYLDEINPQIFYNKIFTKALTDGTYYGVIQSLNKQEFILLDLPAGFCRSRFKDMFGRDIIEFDVSYFNSFTDEDILSKVLAAYPKEVASHWRKYQKQKVNTSWVKIPAEISLYFSFLEEGTPLFLDVIPATIQYEESVDIERERDLDEIRKILIQKIPHMNDGTLLFEPEEALEMHTGAVGMMKGNKNLSVLTTYADVDAIVSKTTSDAVSNNIEKMLQNIYAKANVSGQIFSPTGSQALSTSILNDISLMMPLANKISKFISELLSQLFGNANIYFKYKILPVSIYNQSDYLTDAFKLAQSGYSFFLPGVVLDLDQRDLVSMKELENNIENLQNKLIPLNSAYTQSSDPGRPEMKIEEKAQTTIEQEASKNKQGGLNTDE